MPAELSPAERIIVALDLDDAERAAQVVADLLPYVGGFKVGYQLGYGIGWEKAARLVRDAGGRVFLDTKLADIPNTVGAGVGAVARLQPWMINVHASCGIDAMKAAVANKGEALMLAVTVLTSMDDAESEHIFGVTAREKVRQFALDAVSAGIDGVVCSPQELSLLGEDGHFDKLLRVTPGVRPQWAAANDQQRVTTPAEAVALGADYLVIGRPIMSPPDAIGASVEAAKMVADEIGAGS